MPPLADVKSQQPDAQCAKHESRFAFRDFPLEGVVGLIGAEDFHLWPLADFAATVFQIAAFEFLEVAVQMQVLGDHRLEYGGQE